jgi:hypothetical protein
LHNQKIRFIDLNRDELDFLPTRASFPGIPVNRVYPPLFELDAYWKWPEPGRTIDDLRSRCPNALCIGQTAFAFHHRLLLGDTSVIESMADTVGLVVAEILGTA